MGNRYRYSNWCGHIHSRKMSEKSKDYLDSLGSANGAFDMLYGMYISKSLMAELYEDMNARGYLVVSIYTVTINIQEDVYTY